MPMQLFGLKRPAVQPDFPGFAQKNSSNTAITEVRRPSMDNVFKRPTLAGLGKKNSSRERREKSGKERSQSKHKDAPRSPGRPKPVKLDLVMESPPVLFLGTPADSNGAIISGRLQVSPSAGDVVMDSIKMFLECTTSTTRPVEARCRECMTSVNDLYEWKFLSKQTTFKATKGTQELPFSHLIPGHIPAATHGQIGTIDYSLHVRAKSADGQETEYRRDLVIQRALRPGNDKNSVRIFPPTNLSLNVTLPSVIHPIGEFPITCRMTGVTNKRDDTQTRWRLRKLTWRIEEKETMVSPACAKHAAKVGGEGKGVQHTSEREIGTDEMKGGWKTDFSDGQIDGEFMAAVNTALKPQCSVDAPNGLKISHILVIELVIAEEWAPNKKPTQATPTGAARVLRTQFNLNVTDRSGMGISWDDEMPPAYEDVPHSPPHYGSELTTMTDYVGEEISGDMEHLSLRN
ncbi:Endocytosis regulator [Elasticomyces elasticus]|nr:Endocytosis regulator [Elasticomyces elasticus]KAK5746637.1 Endocytosis regulator [Elasticomyces elasticus]